MITNELYDGQGLGNQLWNYAVTRIIADRRTCDFSIQGRKNFKGRDFLDVDLGMEQSHYHTYYKERAEYLQGTDVDISRTDPVILDLPCYTRFDGNCQSTNYLQGYREPLRQWIRLNPEYNKYETSDATCVMHCRAGDFTHISDVFLPAEYYRNAMTHVASMKPGIRFVCVTDEPRVAAAMLPGVEIIGSALAGYRDTSQAAHHKGGPLGVDFGYLMNARYLIIPNSSFSWWPAYLSRRAELIIAPKYWARHNVSDGYWSTSDIVTDGFTYLDRRGVAYEAEVCRQEKTAYEDTHPEIYSSTARRPPHGMAMLTARIFATFLRRLGCMPHANTYGASDLRRRPPTDLSPHHG